MRIHCPHCQNGIDLVIADGERGGVCPSCGSRVVTIELEDATLRAPAGRTIGRFELLEVLGSGQFGEVWKARDAQLDREVALKIPRKTELAPAEVELFLREARAAAQLQHPHIVRVHDVGLDGERVYIVSELIRGMTLSELLQLSRPNYRQAAEMCATLADALHFAHEAGIVHRDFKPGNVLLDEKLQPHLTDFGLAKRNGGEITMTLSGQILGTPAYMSPEQARGDAHDADRRSDVYSLGVVLYEMLTGKRPFQSKSRMLLHQVIHDDPRPPRKLQTDVPIDLETICLKAMEKVPQRRYQTAEEMAADLRRYLAGEPILGRRRTRREQAARWVRRNRALAASLALAFFATAALGAMATYNIAYSGVPRRVVNITTAPEKARMAFIPLRSTDGQPQPERIVRPWHRSPVRVKLAPGDYLVVAWLEDGRFQEVYRRVPGGSDGLPGAFRHNGWQLNQAGEVDLRPVDIPSADVVAEMTAFSGSPRFQVGAPGLTLSPPHNRSLPAFYLDRTEVTVADYFREISQLPPALRADPPPGTHPITYISYDEALAYAEKIGMRLPDEFEYEFAATSGGTTKYPWGNAELLQTWTFGPVGEPAFDRTPTNPPVSGLYSNVAEWTVSRFDFSSSQGGGPKLPSDGTRIVRGGAQAVISGEPTPSVWKAGAADRTASPRQTKMPGLGFRCARSAKPRLTEADFGAALDP